MSDNCDRREFARRAVFSSLAIGTSHVHAEETIEDDSDEESTREIEDLLLDVLQQQYPSEKLTPEVLQQIRRDIAGHRYRSRVLKEVDLTNGEAPFVFTVVD